MFIGNPDDPSRATITEADHLEGIAPNTTVVILNWSRFDNVRLITSTICEDLLDDTVDSILVWNNNPLPISYEDFLNTSCPEKALKIVNSLENVYFEARYIACAQADTPFCFIQDDDYLVRPEIIRMLNLHMNEQPLDSIHLQPPEEMLSSKLRTIMVKNFIHTTFAWLGYGTIIRRSLAVDFLGLLDQIQLSDEEHKMADNYFTILSNAIPERWFDPGIPLGGGQPFTVGELGEQRNNHHIIRAANLLQSILSRDFQPLNLPYVRFPPHPHNEVVISRAPCQFGLCLLETSIRLLPEGLDRSLVSTAAEIFEVEKRRLEQLGEIRKLNYLQFPLSNIVDGRYETAFHSADNAKAGDWIMLDMARPFYSLESTLVLVLGRETDFVLHSTIFEASQDGTVWERYASEIKCSDVLDPEVNLEVPLRECRTAWGEGVRRFYRMHLPTDVRNKWIIHEMFVE